MPSASSQLTVPSLRTHIETLIDAYGPPLLLSLLDEKGDEAELAAGLKACVSHLNHSSSGGGGGGSGKLQLCEFDFHAHCKGLGSRADGLRELLSRLNALTPADARPLSHGFFALIAGGTQPSRMQRGIVRTNCLDCLNRTNMAQTVLALQSASEQLRGLCRACGLGEVQPSASMQATLHATLRKLWTETGDAISMQYTGTSNLSKGSNITGDAPKKSFFDKASGFAEKAAKTVNRYVHEQFLEDTKQVAIDALLGVGQPARERQRRAVASRRSGVGTGRHSPMPALAQPLTLFVGTWNVNGKVCTPADLTAWLKDPSSKLGGSGGAARGLGKASAPASAEAAAAAEAAVARPSMYIIGFQEFVDLTAKNLLSQDDKRKKECQTLLATTLSAIHGESYVPVCVEQMFGLLLLVYVRPWLAEHVRGVVARSCACGFGSDSLGVKAGNKGGVSVRLDVCGASLCIVNTHLPAGQSHPEERNATYVEVLKGLEHAFAQARGGPHPPPLQHELCVWLGDLNYRLEQPNEVVRRTVIEANRTGRWADLLMHDQLKLAQRSALAFAEFLEAPIAFQPTYKYDAGTQVYDTSEKARTPSWTDRVLWRYRAGSVTSLAYTCTQQVVISDHKPVSSLLLWTPSANDAGAVPHASLSSPLSSPSGSAAAAASFDLLGSADTPGGSDAVQGNDGASPAAVTSASSALDDLIGALDGDLLGKGGDSSSSSPSGGAVASFTAAGSAPVVDVSDVSCTAGSVASASASAMTGYAGSEDAAVRASAATLFPASSSDFLPPPAETSPPAMTQSASEASTAVLFPADNLFGSAPFDSNLMHSSQPANAAVTSPASTAAAEGGFGPKPTAMMMPQLPPADFAAPGVPPRPMPQAPMPPHPMPPAGAAMGSTMSTMRVGSQPSLGGVGAGATACETAMPMSSVSSATTASAAAKAGKDDETVLAFDDLGIGNLLANSGKLA